MVCHAQKIEVEKQRVIEKLRIRLQNAFFKSMRRHLEGGKKCRTSDPPSKECSIHQLPNEMLEKVLENLDKASRLNARAVNSHWAALIEKRLANTLPVVTANRMSISFDAELNSYKLRWCRYGVDDNGQARCRELFITKEDIKEGRCLGFIFQQMSIQQLIIESMQNGTLTDVFVKYMCKQFSHCRQFTPIQLTLRNADMGKLSSDTLKSLMVTCSEKLEVLEFCDIDNVASDLITDEHVLLLGGNKVRRLSIQFKDNNDDTSSPVENLQVGDTSLEAFAERGIFPSFTMARCMVTAPAVCQYVKDWLDNVSRSENLKTHSLTLSECPNMCGDELEERCRTEGLTVSKKSTEDVSKFPCHTSGEGTLVTYTIHAQQEQQVFQINLLTVKS